MLLFVATPLLAATAMQGETSDAASLVASLTTAIVFVATWLVRKARPHIPSWATMLVVLGLTSLTTLLTNQLGNPDLSPLAQIGLGLASTFVHQLGKQFKDAN